MSGLLVLCGELAPLPPKRLPFQGSWLGKAETERLSQICSCRLPPAAPSFLSQEKRWGEKRVLGDTGCIWHLNSGEPLCFSLAFHSVITLRVSWYAPPDTGGSKFATSCRRIPAINRRCRPGLLVCTFLHWILLFCTHQRLPFQGPIPPIRGKCPEGTKGVGMLSPKVTERLSQICCDLSVSASPSHLPWKGRPLCA